MRARRLAKVLLAVDAGRLIRGFYEARLAVPGYRGVVEAAGWGVRPTGEVIAGADEGLLAAIVTFMVRAERFGCPLVTVAMEDGTVGLLAARAAELAAAQTAPGRAG